MPDMRKIAVIGGKVATVALAGTMALTMVACGKKGDSDATDTEDTTEVTATDTTDDADDGTTDATTTQGAASAYAYDYTPGTLCTVMNADGTEPAVPDFAVSGLIMVGNQQEEDAAATLAGGYRTTGLKSDYHLNEWIEFYLDDATLAQCGDDTNIVALPHSDASEYADIPYEKLTMATQTTGGFALEVSQENINRESGYNLVSSGYVNADGGITGLWDILFVKGGKVAQYVCVEMAPSI